MPPTTRDGGGGCLDIQCHPGVRLQQCIHTPSHPKYYASRRMVWGYVYGMHISAGPSLEGTPWTTMYQHKSTWARLNKEPIFINEMTKQLRSLHCSWSQTLHESLYFFLLHRMLAHHEQWWCTTAGQTNKYLRRRQLRVRYTMYIGTFSATSVQQFCPIRGQGDLFANTHELDLQILPNEACFLLCIGGSLELIRFSDILLCWIYVWFGFWRCLWGDSPSVFFGGLTEIPGRLCFCILADLAKEGL